MVAVEVAELPHWSVTTTMTSYVPTAHVQLAFVVMESNIYEAKNHSYHFQFCEWLFFDSEIKQT